MLGLKSATGTSAGAVVMMVVDLIGISLTGTMLYTSAEIYTLLPTSYCTGFQYVR